MGPSRGLDEKGLKSAYDILGAGAVACYASQNYKKFAVPSCKCQFMHETRAIRQLQMYFSFISLSNLFLFLFLSQKNHHMVISQYSGNSRLLQNRFLLFTCESILFQTLCICNLISKSLCLQVFITFVSFKKFDCWLFPISGTSVFFKKFHLQISSPGIF